MKQVLEFLRELSCNNNREWFTEHKAEYLQAKATFERFSLSLLEEIRKFDSSIGNLGIGDITYRIYRDVRFSANKDPYKTHMGVYICKGGKKSGYSGYYFHVSADAGGGWESGHMVAAGDYMCDPKVLAIIREDIEAGDGDFREILSHVDPRLKLEMDGALKKVPKDFPSDTPDSDFYRLKRFCLSGPITDDMITSPDLMNDLIRMFRSAKPFLDYINRAIHYSRTGE